MMKRSQRCALMLLLAGLLLNSMGCRYLTNRYYDFRDTFDLGVGVSSENSCTGILPPALGLYLEATDFLQLGAISHYGYIAECDLRGSGVYHEDRARLGFGPWQAIHLDQDYLNGHVNYFKTPNTKWELWMKSVPQSFCGAPAKDLTYTHWAQDMQFGCFLRHRGYQYWEYCGLEGAICDPFFTHLGLYLRAGFDISEVSDCILGWFGIDFKHDDLTPAMFAEKNNKVIEQPEPVVAAPAAPAPVVPSGPSQDEYDKLKAENADLAKKLADVEGKLKELEGGVEIELPESVLFDTGRATLKPEGMQLLAQVAAKIKREYPGQQITVQGHTDSRPVVVHKDSYKSNWELGSALANAVVHFLEDNQGLKVFKSESYSANKPEADDSTPEGRQKNRRAMIVLRAKK